MKSMEQDVEAQLRRRQLALDKRSESHLVPYTPSIRFEPNVLNVDQRRDPPRDAVVIVATAERGTAIREIVLLDIKNK
jgi:hypothetical protein